MYLAGSNYIIIMYLSPTCLLIFIGALSNPLCGFSNIQNWKSKECLNVENSHSFVPYRHIYIGDGTGAKGKRVCAPPFLLPLHRKVVFLYEPLVYPLTYSSYCQLGEKYAPLWSCIKTIEAIPCAWRPLICYVHVDCNMNVYLLQIFTKKRLVHFQAYLSLPYRWAKSCKRYVVIYSLVISSSSSYGNYMISFV